MQPRWHPLALTLLAAGCSTATHPAVPMQDLAFQFASADLAVSCKPGDPPSCSDAQTVRTCRLDGSGYDYTTCAGPCIAGACGCNPGDLTCMGDDVERCGMDNQLHKDHTCPPGTCQDGACTTLCAEEMGVTNPHALALAGWPRFRHDNRNTGVTSAVVADMPKLKWQVKVGGDTNAGLYSAAIINKTNQVFIGGGQQDGFQGALHGLDANGKLLFHTSVNRQLDISTPSITADGTIYVSSNGNGAAYAIDTKGNVLWQQPIGRSPDASPILTKAGVVIFGSDDGNLYAFDSTGKQLWMSAAFGEVDGALGESCQGQVVGIGPQGLFALDAVTGKALWTIAIPTPQQGTNSPMIDVDGTIYFWENDGTGRAVDAKGNVIWKNQIVNGINFYSTPLKIGPLLYIVLTDGNLHGVDAATGADKWSHPVGGGAMFTSRGGPIADGKNRIYYSGYDGFLYAFDTAGKQLWKQPFTGQNGPVLGGIVGNPSIGPDGTLYVPANDAAGTLFAFQ